MFSTIKQTAVSQPAPAALPGRITEDAYFYEGDETQATLLVIDGATERLKAAGLRRLISASGTAKATAASYAANLARTVIAERRDLDLRSRLLAANLELRRKLATVYPSLAADGILQVEPDLWQLKENPRLLRMLLPACVATLVKIDWVAEYLEFAHIGDTALFIFSADGAVTQITADQMGQHDRQALQLAKEIQEREKLPHFIDAITQESVIEKNKYNAIYHNFVDEAGSTDAKVGVGVINGLPELSAYIQSGRIALQDVSGVLVCSDGFIWPQTWDNEPGQDNLHLKKMGQLIKEEGLAPYLALLRACEAADPRFDQYPRFKRHDDATAIFCEFSK